MKLTSQDRNFIDRLEARGEDNEKILWAFYEDNEEGYSREEIREAITEYLNSKVVTN
jgi:hypothetical protein